MSPLERLDDVPALLESKSVPGLTLAYITDDDADPVTHVWGVASTADDRPVTTDTVFRAGSVSKPVTAFAALRLAADGHLDLDADVNTLLHSWRLPAVEGWQPVVTTRMLLAHVAGTSGWGDSAGYDDTEPPASLVDVLEGRGDMPALTFHALPNVMWLYSSGGYLVVQLVITDVMGVPFPEAIRKLVFQPLGMTSSTFEAPLPVRWRAVAADGHLDGRAVPAPPIKDPAMADGGMWTTPSDLMLLARAINTNAVPEMLVGHPVERRMGLGLFLNDYHGVRWWSHDGSVPGFECHLGGAAETGFAVAAMTNAPEGASVAGEVAGLLGALYGPGRPAIRPLTWDGIAAAIRMNNHNLKAVGTYRLPGGGEVVLTAAPPDKWGQQGIELTLPGQPTIPLAWPVTDGRWRVPGFETMVIFDPPDGLRFLHGGQEVRAERVR